MMPLNLTDTFCAHWLLCFLFACLFLQVWTSSKLPLAVPCHMGDTTRDISVTTWDGWVIL